MPVVFDSLRFSPACPGPRSLVTELGRSVATDFFSAMGRVSLFLVLGQQWCNRGEAVVGLATLIFGHHEGLA